MAGVPMPNGAIFEIASTIGTPIAFTAITNANPPELTSVGHGLANGDILIVESGWPLLDGSAARVAGSATDNFDLEGFNTTNTALYTAGAGAGSVIPVDDWIPILKVLTIEKAGGDTNMVDAQYIEDNQNRQFPGSKNAMTLTLTVQDNPTAAYTALVESLDELQGQTVVRMKRRNGEVEYFPGFVTISPATAGRDAIDSRTITVAMNAPASTRYDFA